MGWGCHETVRGIFVDSTMTVPVFLFWLSHQEVLILWAIWNRSSKSCWSRHERARYSSIHPGHSTNISQMFSVHKAKKSSTWTFILIECTTPIDLLFAWTGGVVLFGAILVLVDRLSLIFFFVRAARSNMKKQTSSDHSALWKDNLLFWSIFISIEHHIHIHLSHREKISEVLKHIWNVCTEPRIFGFCVLCPLLRMFRADDWPVGSVANSTLLPAPPCGQTHRGSLARKHPDNPWYAMMQMDER